MKKEYLSIQALENLKNFKYNCTNDSILYNNVTSPVLDKYIMKLIPMWVAPNLITLFSFIFNFITFLVIFLEAGNDFEKPLSKWTCLLQGISHLLYIILDNSDGKQARRTNSCSPMGLLFDHGFDALTSVLIAFNMSHMVMTGNEGIRTVLMISGMYIGFWAQIYEEYITGYLHLGMINGADEGNLIITVSAFLSAIFGVEIWKIELFFGFTLAEFMISVLLIGSLQCVIQAILNIYRKTKKIEDLLDFLFYNSLNFSTILFLFFLSLFDQKFLRNNFTLMFIALSITYSHIIIEMQINIVTSQQIKFNHFFRFSLFGYSAILILMNKTENILLKQSLLIGLIVINLVYFLHYVINCLSQMKKYLGIKIFSIVDKED